MYGNSNNMTLLSVMFRLLVVLLVSLSIMGLNEIENTNYGPYEPYLEDVGRCKGPKKTDCGTFIIDCKARNLRNVTFVMDFQKDCLVSKAKIFVANKTNNSTKVLFNYVIENPCQHFVFGQVLKEAFNLTKACKISKGHYKVHIDMYNKTKTFLGENFFYGTYWYKMYAHNNDQNLFCSHAQLRFGKPEQ